MTDVQLIVQNPVVGVEVNPQGGLDVTVNPTNPPGPQGEKGDKGDTGDVGQTGPIGRGYDGLTSATNTSVGTGTKNFQVNQAFGTNAFVVGQLVRVIATSNTNAWMIGKITQYGTNGAFQVDVSYNGNTGTFNSWRIVPSGEKGDTGATGAAGMNWRGAYNSATAYAINDVVSLNGTSYIARAPVTNVNPVTGTASWNPVAVKGDPGPANLYIQPNQPAFTVGQPAIWVQTGLGESGQDQTIHLYDGVA